MHFFVPNSSKFQFVSVESNLLGKWKVKTGHTITKTFLNPMAISPIIMIFDIDLVVLKISNDIWTDQLVETFLDVSEYFESLS